MREGARSSDPYFLTGPRQSRWETVFLGAFDITRVCFPQELLLDCYQELYGHEPGGTIQLLETAILSDAALRQLGYAFAVAHTYSDIVGATFSDSVGLSFVSRLLSTYCGRANTVLQRRHLFLSSRQFQAVVEYIDANLGQPIYLSQLSDLAGLAKTHFSNEFRRVSGYTPHAFILRRRILRAQQMMMDRKHSPVDIALALGFATQAHFNTAFKKIVGHAPERWRAAQRESAQHDEWHEFE